MFHLFEQIADVVRQAAIEARERLAVHVGCSRLAEDFSLIAAALQELPERMRAGLDALASNGWYLIPEGDLPLLWKSSELIASGNHVEAENLLCRSCEESLDEFLGRVERATPNRSNIIAQAISAHRAQQYACSVPVLLAQADGISNEKFGVSLYAKSDDGQPRTRGLVEAFDASSFESALLEPFRKHRPILASRAERASNLGRLNRHAVLHGESTNYDTREFSCQAISQLSYVVWLLAE